MSQCSSFDRGHCKWLTRQWTNKFYRFCLMHMGVCRWLASLKHTFILVSWVHYNSCYYRWVKIVEHIISISSASAGSGSSIPDWTYRIKWPSSAISIAWQSSSLAETSPRTAVSSLLSSRPLRSPRQSLGWSCSPAAADSWWSGLWTWGGAHSTWCDTPDYHRSTLRASLRRPCWTTSLNLAWAHCQYWCRCWKFRRSAYELQLSAQCWMKN